jgi:hypothetical protein
MIVPDRNEYIGFGFGKLPAHHFNALYHFVAAGRTIRLLEQPWHEWIVSDAYDRDDLSHGASFSV